MKRFIVSLLTAGALFQMAAGVAFAREGKRPNRAAAVQACVQEAGSFLAAVVAPDGSNRETMAQYVRTMCRLDPDHARRVRGRLLDAWAGKETLTVDPR